MPHYQWIFVCACPILTHSKCYHSLVQLLMGSESSSDMAAKEQAWGVLEELLKLMDNNKVGNSLWVVHVHLPQSPGSSFFQLKYWPEDKIKMIATSILFCPHSKSVADNHSKLLNPHCYRWDAVCMLVRWWFSMFYEVANQSRTVKPPSN